MDLNSLYTLEHKGSVHVRPEYIIKEALPLLKGIVVPDEPLNFDQFIGSVNRDFIPATQLDVYLVSKKVQAALLECGATGWKTYPVSVSNKHGEPVAGYAGLVVSGRSGPIDKALSRVERRPPPVQNGKPYMVRVGLFFDPDTWDGSDMFSPEGRGWIIVTQKVKDCLEKIKATNVRFVRLTEFELSV